MAIRAEAQLRLDDEVIDDEVLEDLLYQWQDAKDALAAPRQEYDTRNKRLKGDIEARDLEPGTYRCGAFVITIRTSDSREVHFERKSSRSIRVTRAKE